MAAGEAGAGARPGEPRAWTGVQSPTARLSCATTTGSAACMPALATHRPAPCDPAVRSGQAGRRGRCGLVARLPASQGLLQEGGAGGAGQGVQLGDVVALGTVLLGCAGIG